MLAAGRLPGELGVALDAVRRVGVADVPLGLLVTLLDGLPLDVLDLPQALGDLVVDAAEIVVRQALLTLLTQLLEDLPQALDAVTVAVVEPGLQQPAQRRRRVAVVQQVVGELAQDVEGVEVEPLLRTVPTRIAEPVTQHGSTLGHLPPLASGRPRSLTGWATVGSIPKRATQPRARNPGTAASNSGCC
jgi:hypothetical protein